MHADHERLAAAKTPSQMERLLLALAPSLPGADATLLSPPELGPAMRRFRADAEKLGVCVELISELREFVATMEPLIRHSAANEHGPRRVAHGAPEPAERTRADAEVVGVAAAWLLTDPRVTASQAHTLVGLAANALRLLALPRSLAA